MYSILIFTLNTCHQQHVWELVAKEGEKKEELKKYEEEEKQNMKEVVEDKEEEK